MAMIKHVARTGKHFRGYVEIGSGTTPAGSTAVATEVLVLLVVVLNAHWKVAYPLVIF